MHTYRFSVDRNLVHEKAEEVFGLEVDRGQARAIMSQLNRDDNLATIEAIVIKDKEPYSIFLGSRVDHLLYFIAWLTVEWVEPEPEWTFIPDEYDYFMRLGRTANFHDWENVDKQLSYEEAEEMMAKWGHKSLADRYGGQVAWRGSKPADPGGVFSAIYLGKYKAGYGSGAIHTRETLWLRYKQEPEFEYVLFRSQKISRDTAVEILAEALMKNSQVRWYKTSATLEACGLIERSEKWIRDGGYHDSYYNMTMEARSVHRPLFEPAAISFNQEAQAEYLTIRRKGAVK